MGIGEAKVFIGERFRPVADGEGATQYLQSAVDAVESTGALSPRNIQLGMRHILDGRHETHSALRFGDALSLAMAKATELLSVIDQPRLDSEVYEPTDAGQVVDSTPAPTRSASMGAAAIRVASKRPKKTEAPIVRAASLVGKQAYVPQDARGFGDDDDSLAWQEKSLCAQTDPEAFFPEKGGSTREAKKICTGCEVRAECLEYALDNDERFGIWGGLSERERRKLKKKAS